MHQKRLDKCIYNVYDLQLRFVTYRPKNTYKVNICFHCYSPNGCVMSGLSMLREIAAIEMVSVYISGSEALT